MMQFVHKRRNLRSNGAGKVKKYRRGGYFNDNIQ
jgi:hypothetical protein